MAWEDTTTDQTAEDQSPPSEERDLGRELREVYERRLERFNLKPETVAEEPAEEEKAAAPPPTQEAKPKPVQPAQQTISPPKRGFLDRQEKRRGIAALEARIAELTELVAKVVPKEEAKTPPEPGTDEYAKHLVQQALREELGPETIQHLRQSRERAEQEEAARRQQAEAQERIAAWAETIQTSEAAYRRDNPTAAEGYYERVVDFVEQSMRKWVELGDSQEKAYWTTIRTLGALSEEGIRRGFEPAEFIDWTIKSSRAAQAAPGGNGKAEPEPEPEPDPTEERRSQQRQENAAVRERREAAKRAGSPQATGGAPREASPVSKVRSMAQGGGARELVKAATRTSKSGGVSAKELLRQLRDELTG